MNGQEPEDFEDYDQTEDCCDHDEFDIDILEGRAQCARCGYAWYATVDQLLAQERLVREYAEWEAAQHRHDNAWWRRLGWWLAATFRRNFFDRDLPF